LLHVNIDLEDVSHSFKDRSLWITQQDREPQGRLPTAHPEGDSCRKDLSLTDLFPLEPIERGAFKTMILVGHGKKWYKDN